jgi:hypothetical protein
VEAFRAALDSLFADPNLGQTALWKVGGAEPGTPVSVIVKAPDAGDSFGDTRVVLPAVILDVRKAEVAAPREGDLVEAEPLTLKVVGTPTIDRLGLVWTCEAVEV